jgi:uncharacterized membrane protein
MRSQTQNLGNPIVVATLLSLLVVTIGLCIVALSEWSVTGYGLKLGVGLLVFYTSVFAKFGSLSVFWIGPTAVGLLVATIHIWIGYSSSKNKKHLSETAFPPKAGQFIVVMLAGFVAFRFGGILGPLMRQTNSLYPLTAGVGLVVVIYAFIRHFGYKIDTVVSTALVITIGVWMYAAFFSRPEFRQFGTDAILFGKYSAELALQGSNPYTQSMLPAFDKYSIDLRFVTYRTDGSIVTSYSYPGGGIIMFMLAQIINIINPNWVSIAFFMATIVFLVAEADGFYKFGSLAVILSSHEYAMFSSGGVFDIIYVFLLLLGMKMYHQKDYHWAAFIIGLSFSIKQIPWLIGPYIAVWLYMSSPDLDMFQQRVYHTLSFGFVGFLIPNIPFLVTAPVEWLGGVLTPVAGGAALTMQGIALSSLVTHDLIYLPRSYFVLSIISAYALTVLLYIIWFDKIKWIAWILPSVVLFFHYRSLLAYYIYVPILSWYAILLRSGATSSTALNKLENIKTRVSND